MSDGAIIPLPATDPFERLSDAELRRLRLWATRSTLPAWNRFDPTLARTPVETITQLIAENIAYRAVLELGIDQLADLGELICRVLPPKPQEPGNGG